MPRNPTPPAKDTEYLIGGAIDKKYFSTTGAFNGSGIALASQSFSPSGSDAAQGTIVMYFQHVGVFIVNPIAALAYADSDVVDRRHPIHEIAAKRRLGRRYYLRGSGG